MGSEMCIRDRNAPAAVESAVNAPEAAVNAPAHAASGGTLSVHSSSSTSAISQCTSCQVASLIAPEAAANAPDRGYSLQRRRRESRIVLCPYPFPVCAFFFTVFETPLNLSPQHDLAIGPHRALPALYLVGEGNDVVAPEYVMAARKNELPLP